jgi:hypothetical protein
MLYEIFERAKHKRIRYWRGKEAYPSTELLGECFCLFFEYLSVNNYRAFVTWPDKIKDKETLSKLYMLFISEMTKMNVEIRGRFRPVEFQPIENKKLIARGMDTDDFLGIARDVADQALMPDDLYLRKYQNTFYHYKMDDVSRPVVQFLVKIRNEIYGSQTSKKTEDDSLEASSRNELDEKQKELEEQAKQKELEKLARKLKIIDRKRKKDRNNPHPHSNYDYGSVTEEYDPFTGQKTKIWIPNLTPDYQGQEH